MDSDDDWLTGVVSWTVMVIDRQVSLDGQSRC